MNLRLVHALLILLSAALAVLFGVWCLGQYGRDDGVAQPGRGHRGVRRVARPGRLRLVVPAQDEDAAMKPIDDGSTDSCTLMAVLLGGGSTSSPARRASARRRRR